MAHRGNGGERGEGRGERRAHARQARSRTFAWASSNCPARQRAYNSSDHAWDQRAEDDDPHVPLLAVAGRLGVVSAKSDRIEAAFQLLLWLSDSRMSWQLSARSPATTLFRQSNVKSPKPWVEKPISATAAVQYADAAEAAFRHESWLGALRLPGRAEYLAALDAAVQSAVRGQQSPQDALIAAAAQWRKITERLGVDRQRTAYRHSLGLE